MSFVTQTVIPLLFLLAIPGLSRRRVALLLPLAHLPDLDYVLGFHRATTHNLFILLPAAFLLWWWRRPATRHEGRAEGALIALVYLGSHLLMDVFAGGITLVHPFSAFTACYRGYIEVLTATNTPILTFESCHFVGIPVVTDRYLWLSPTEVAWLAFLVPGGLLAWGIRRWRARRRPSP